MTDAQLERLIAAIVEVQAEVAALRMASKPEPPAFEMTDAERQVYRNVGRPGRPNDEDRAAMAAMEKRRHTAAEALWDVFGKNKPNA